MGEKKNKIVELAAQTEPKLSRAEIARQVSCSTPYVTQVLGAVRPYRIAKTKPGGLCIGCADEACKANGCMAA